MRLPSAATSAVIRPHSRGLGSDTVQVLKASARGVGSAAAAALKDRGYAFLTSAGGRQVMQISAARLHQIAGYWDRLLPDAYLRDSGRYRFRRHSCFVQDVRSGLLSASPHRPHWQSTQYNALHGGINRLFEPIETQFVTSAVWMHLLTGIGNVFAKIQAVDRWFIEAHQFRIDTAEGIGRPTPEGAHRDGVDFVAVVLIRRRGVSGGETRVYAADGRYADRSTLREPGSMLLMDDARVIHETTPIRPTAVAGMRDTLVLTYRQRGFQSSGG